jgi:hypothetical protein
LRQRRVAGVVDVIQVDDPAEIKAVATDPRINRKFETPTCPVNWFIVKRSLSVLSFRGRRFPTMEPRENAERARAQGELFHRLNEQAEKIKRGPQELEALAKWIRGESDGEIGVLAQQAIGRLFRDDFAASTETWEAALTIMKARSLNLFGLVAWHLSGKLQRAQALLAGMVNEDMFAMNGIAVSVHNMVTSLREMKLLYAQAGERNTLTASEAAEKCLRAPVSLYRQATEEAHLLGTTVRKHAILVLNLGTASKLPGGRPLIFLEETWSGCPASTWVPAMLEGLWRRANQ